MAGVLRREQFCSKPAFSFQDVEREARAVLERAEARAREIMAAAEQQARRRAAQIEAEAGRRGLEEGRREGIAQVRREAAQRALQEARQELNQLGEALRNSLAAFDAEKRHLLACAERGLIELALAITRRVCKHELGASSQTALANARAVLKLAEHEHDLRLHLHPADCEALRQTLPELAAATGSLTHVELVADSAVPRGGCILRGRDGTIDARLERQLDRVAEALLGVATDETNPTTAHDGQQDAT